MVIKNYNAVLDRKEEKLASLKNETAGKPGGNEIVAEMEEIVQDMYITYWNRINSSMLRFTDTRLLKWRIFNASKYEYIPVMGAGETIYVKRTPVTNEEYAEYLSETGAKAPSNWTNGTYPKGEEDYPVNFVSYKDAENYCAWLTKNDGVNTYVPELYRLFRITNDKRWYERAKAVWQNGCQQISDGTLKINGLTRPVGSQDEFFETTRQSLDGRKNSKPGTSSGWLVAWPCAFRLDVIHKLKDIPEADDFFEMSDRY